MKILSLLSRPTTYNRHCVASIGISNDNSHQDMITVFYNNQLSLCGRIVELISIIGLTIGTKDTFGEFKAFLPFKNNKDRPFNRIN